LREGFHKVFGKDLPADIQRILQLIETLGTQSDYVKVFAENMKMLKANERDDTVGEDIQSWVNLIDTMEQALPTMDKQTKAYETLKEQIAAARKELDRLMDVQRKKEDDGAKSEMDNYKAWLQSMKQYTNLAATGMAKAWENTFLAMQHGMRTTAAIWKMLGGGIISTLFGGLGQFAIGKAEENALLAAEMYVHAYAASVNPLTAALVPLYIQAGVRYTGMAAAWAAAAGAGAFASSAISGGSAGSSARDVGGTNAQNAQPTNIVNVYVDGVDPKNPRHQQLVGDTTREYMERTGQQVFINPRRP
jgi:hypothetical protein